MFVLVAGGRAEAQPLWWWDDGGTAAIDTLRPGSGRSVTAASCPSSALCVVTDQSGGVFASTSGAWRYTEIARDRTLTDVDCPTVALCVAVGELGTIATSTNPAGGVWTSAHVGTERLGMVECPAANLCVAADFSGTLYTSTSPATGPWTPAQTPALEDLDCPAVDLCAGVSFTGVVSSTNPTSAASWSYAPLDWPHYAQNISCGSRALCVVGGSSGYYATATNPAGGTAAWTVARFGTDHGYEIQCGSATLCVATEFDGTTTYTTNTPTGAWAPRATGSMIALTCTAAGHCLGTDDSPRGAVLSTDDPGSGAWQRTSFDRIEVRALNAVACPAPSLCLAVDDAGQVLASSDPRSGAWGAEAALGGSLTAIACPTAAFCLAGDGSGGLFTRQGGAWQRAAGGGDAAIRGVDCVSAALCFAVDATGRILRSTGAGWSTVRPPDGQVLRGVSCPSSTLCVAVGDSGRALVSGDAGATWASQQVSTDSDPLLAVSCPSDDLCVAGGRAGRLLVSLAPTRDWSWGAGPELSGAKAIAAVDCPSQSLCVAADAEGQAWASNDPAGGKDAWAKGTDWLGQVHGAACAGDAVCVLVDDDGFAQAARGDGVPFNTSAPTVSNDGVLHCSPGGWSPAPTSLSYQWERSGYAIAGATGDTYTPSGYGTFQCRVTAKSPAGDATARGSITLAPVRSTRPISVPRPRTPLPAPAFSARVSAVTPRLAALRRSGLAVTVTCSQACTVTVALRVDARDRRRLGGLKTIGTAKVTLAAAGSAKARARLSAKARRALARTSKVRLTLEATEALQRPVTGARTLTVRR